MTKNGNGEPGDFSNGPEPTSPLSTDTGGQSDEQRWGRDTLRDGLALVIERGRLLACQSLLGDEETEALVDAWYAAVVDVIPCRYWKEVGLYASRYTNPADKLTLRQFFEAWAKFCEQGKARGYESWR